MALKRLLVPVDLSEASTSALDYAIEFAKPFKSEVTILFVVEPLYYSGDLGLLLEEQQRIAHGELAKLEQKVRKHRLKCRTLIHRGTPYVEIVAAAKRSKTDLILMGTHGRTGLSHLILGSVADRVVRTAECPVLTIRPKARRRK